MIRHLHPTDSPALLRFKQSSGQDEVFTLSEAIKGVRKPFPLMKYTTIALSPRAWQSCWVKTRRASVQAVLRAGPLSGRHAWELSDLYLAKKSSEIASEVLEQLAFPAGASGARRIFVRIPTDSDLFYAARSAGYQVAFTQDVYRASSARDVIARTEDRSGDRSGGLQFQPLKDTDGNALFRLYCAKVPVDVRTKTGQTLEEWSSSIENPGRNTRDWVVEGKNSTSLQAHVRSCDVPGGRYFSVRRRDDAECSIESLIAAGVGQADEKQVVTIVPSYDQVLAEILNELGFTRHESYDVMVKTLAVRAAKPMPGLVTAER